MKSVLSGIRVVEQGTFITGPCAGMMLADLGADVIKVESPTGDPYRSYQGGQFSPHFQAYNRNKRSLALDLNQPTTARRSRAGPQCGCLYPKLPPWHGRAPRCRRASAARDESAAGVLLHQRLRIEWTVCRPAELRLGGAGAERILSVSLSITTGRVFSGRRWRTPSLAFMPRIGVLGALFERSRTSRGRLVEVSMLEAMAHFAVEPFAAFFALGQVPKSSDRPRLAQAYILAHRRSASWWRSTCRRSKSSGKG